MYRYHCQLADALDGDTVRVTVDLGFHAFMRIRVRLVGLDAANIHGPGGPEARQFVIDWFAAHPDAVLASTKTGKYGRWLGTFSAGDESLNDALIANGHAVAWDGTGPRPAG